MQPVIDSFLPNKDHPFIPRRCLGVYAMQAAECRLRALGVQAQRPKFDLSQVWPYMPVISVSI